MKKVANLPEINWEKMKKVGYWWTGEGSELEHPKDFIDSNWDKEEKSKVLEYISQCYYPPYAFAGFSWCRMGCDGVSSDIGTQDLTDGTYIFPEGLVHYIKEHNVKPDQEFLNHIKLNNYVVAKLCK